MDKKRITLTEKSSKLSLLLSFSIILTLLTTNVSADCYTSDSPWKDCETASPPYPPGPWGGPSCPPANGGYDPACPTAADIFAEVPHAGYYWFPHDGTRTDYARYNVPSCYYSNCCGGRPQCCDHGPVYCESIMSSTTTTTIPPCLDVPVANHCCPTGFEYDVTSRCCMTEREAVTTAEMFEPQPMSLNNYDSLPFNDDTSSGGPCYQGCAQVLYCEQRIKELLAKSVPLPQAKCQHNMGGCRTQDRCGNWIDECATGLNCTINFNTANNNDSACCLPDERFNGRECVPLGDVTPWYATWTRSDINPTPPGILNQTGGSQIWIYIAGGGMIPNITEASGYEARVPKTEDERFGNTWPNRNCGADGGGEFCYYCEASWPYRVPPSPIWFEARNIGRDYKWAEERGVCNGPFVGTDGAVKNYGKIVMEVTDGLVPAKLECASGDCNCGRDMDDRDGDLENGVINDGVGGCTPTSCNDMQPTGCIRSLDKTAPHQCNRVPRGYGWTENDPTITAGVPVDPSDARYQPRVELMTPEACGRLQRKEVQSYPRVMSESPDSWFDIYVYEFDGNHALVDQTLYPSIDKGQHNNLIPEPGNPWTVLNDKVQDHELSEDTRYLSVNVDYWIENKFERRALVKQCMWIGCSRVEEDVESYSGTTCCQQCDGSWSCSAVSGPPDGPPCCCTERALVPDPNEGSPLWACYIANGCDMLDCDGDINHIPETPSAYAEQHDCWCTYTCWGCWHFSGKTDDYEPTLEGETTPVRERFRDVSKVKAKPYGDHIRVENPFAKEDSEIHLTLDGRLIYNFSSAPAWGMSYITVKAEDDESFDNPGYKPIDTLGGFRMELENVLIMDLNPKLFPSQHELTVLESTLPRDFIIIQDDPSRWDRDSEDQQIATEILRLSDRCRYLVNPMTARTERSKEADDPLWFKWLRNPSKKYLFWHNQFSAYSSIYSHDLPITLVDAAQPDCREYIYDFVYNVRIFRTFREDEPRYYDYVSFYMLPQNIEAGMDYFNFDATKLDTLEVIKFKRHKELQSTYARYAPNCEDRRYDGVGVSCSQSPPDMCSDIARRICNPITGNWDCVYKAAYINFLPVLNDTCAGMRDWRKVDPLRCEGIPSKYKSFCTDDVFHAYWLDEFQFKYKDDGTGHCSYEYLKECEFKNITPNSYTLIFEPASTFQPEDWHNFTFRAYSSLRSVLIDPYGEEGPCDETLYRLTVPPTPGDETVNVTIEKPIPNEPYLELIGFTNTLMDVQVLSWDLCQNVTYLPPNGKDRVVVDFKYPYSKYSGWYDVGDVITGINVSSGIDIRATMKIHDDAGFMQTREKGSSVEVPHLSAWDYMLEHGWAVILFAFFATTSYRLFSGRSMDFKDMWDEFQGKK